MNRFPQIATHVDMAEFTVEENVVGPDDDDDKDKDSHFTILAAPEES